MEHSRTASIRIRKATGVFVALVATACTGSMPGGIRLAQQEETFDSSLADVNTKLDMLWVVDNSGSMGNEQAKLRDGFISFANRYMKPDWDIRLAVITTDTYLAHPSFSGYLDGTGYMSGNYTSGYVNNTISGGRVNPLDNPNPAWKSDFFWWDGSVSRWKTKSGGLSRRHFRPNYGPNWAKLLDSDPDTGKGNHDGPPVTVCFEGSPNSFYSGDPQCRTRDNVSRVTPPVRTGIANCVTPGTGETAISQCVNTALNDSVHSGKSIISTFGVSSEALISQFIVNASVGITGEGSERGIGSVLQLLEDNEAPGSTSALFRADALRVIVFVSDEEDNSIVLPTDGTQINSSAYFKSSCSKTVDGYTYTISRCADPAKVYPAVGAGYPASEVKARLDSFFRGLDGDPAGNPNYFIATITALTAASVQASGDQATNDLLLGEEVGNGSLALEINSSDYGPLLDQIGEVIVQKKGIFVLKRAPSTSERVVVKIRHADGSSTLVPEAYFTVEGKTLTINDQATILSLASTDKIVINYAPSTVY